MCTWIEKNGYDLVTCPAWQGITGGETVCSGYPDDLTAPTGGVWNLYEKVRNHTHIGWVWEPVAE